MTWEDVLAAFEAAADAAEGLLRPPIGETDSPVTFDPWLLALPQLPRELLPRARAIQARQIELAQRLQRGASALRQQETYTRSVSATGARPVLLDQQG